MMVEAGEGYQTVTLVPSETANGEVSYVLVVQEDNKPVIKVDSNAAGGAVSASLGVPSETASVAKLLSF